MGTAVAADSRWRIGDSALVYYEGAYRLSDPLFHCFASSVTTILDQKEDSWNDLHQLL